jgi:hypothetical protein
MKRVLVSLVVVLFVCSIGMCYTQDQGTFVGSQNQQTSWGATGIQVQGTIAGNASSQQQGGWSWNQRECGGAVVVQAEAQGCGFGYKTQAQQATADLCQSQKLGNRCRPDTQNQQTVLQADQGSSQSGSGGFQAQLNGAGAAQDQEQGTGWCNNQRQTSVGAILQVEAQVGGCFGVQDQVQTATVLSAQNQKN